MPTTSNFGWTTPADTDLVKDGAAAIRTLGNGIDTSFLDLKGGTTDQVLAKNSNTDLDFKWVAQDDSNAIQNAIVDAKGDLISATAADTPARLAVGANGTVLTADSTEATGLKWAAPAAGGFVGCRLTRSGTFNVSNNTFTSVSFNSESFDTDAFHDNSTNNSRITIPAGKAGKYLLIGNFLWGTDSTGRRELLMYKNGSALSGRIVMQATSSEGAGLCLSMIQDLAVSDYVELYVRQTSGQTIDTNADNTIFQAQYLGA